MSSPSPSWSSSPPTSASCSPRSGPACSACRTPCWPSTDSYGPSAGDHSPSTSPTTSPRGCWCSPCSADGLTSRRAATSTPGRSVEDRRGGPAALELEEPLGARHRQHAVPEDPCRFAPGCRADDGAEDCHALHTDHRGAHLVADLVHAGAMRLLQGIVELLGVGGIGQRRRQPGLGEGLFDGRPILGLALEVEPVAQGRVERQQDLGPELLLGGDADPDRPPRLGHQFAVLLGQVRLVRVEVGQRHHVPLDLDRADLGRVQDPPRRDPRPRAEGVEPEVGDRPLDGRCDPACVGHCCSSKWRAPRPTPDAGSVFPGRQRRTGRRSRRNGPVPGAASRSAGHGGVDVIAWFGLRWEPAIGRATGGRVATGDGVLRDQVSSLLQARHGWRREPRTTPGALAASLDGIEALFLGPTSQWGRRTSPLDGTGGLGVAGDPNGQSTGLRRSGSHVSTSGWSKKSRTRRLNRSGFSIGTTWDAPGITASWPFGTRRASSSACVTVMKSSSPTMTSTGAAILSRSPDQSNGSPHILRTLSQTAGKCSAPSGVTWAYMAANTAISGSSTGSAMNASIAPATYPELANPLPTMVSERTSSGCWAAIRSPTIPPSLHPRRSQGARSSSWMNTTVCCAIAW